MMSGSGTFRQSAFSHKVTATHLAATDFYNLTEITTTIPPLTRTHDRLIGGGISSCGDVVNIARIGRHNRGNSFLASK
jgi:hypothetical protein